MKTETAMKSAIGFFIFCVITGLIALLLLTGCASIDVQTQYGSISYDGKANRYTLKQK